MVVLSKSNTKKRGWCHSKAVARLVIAVCLISMLVVCRDIAENLSTSNELMSLSSPANVGQESSGGIVLHGDLALSGYATEVWEGLIATPTNTSNLAVVEVGMHRAKQCLQAAEKGFQAHCVEPSPTSFQKISSEVQNLQSAQVKNRIHLYNVAAGNVESTVPFMAGGGTGDHIGEVDMWKMEKVDSSAATVDSNPKATIVQVPTKPLDTVLQNGIPSDVSIYLLKVDTQGFEPQVFAGLDTMLSQHRIQYILTEFWPRGMDFLDETSNEKCIGVPKVLRKLLGYGYRLYVLPAEGHPKAPAYRELPKLQKTRPLDDLDKYCKWYYELEDKYPSDEYKMGYWTDILALAPGAILPERLRQLPTYVQ